MEKSHVGKLEVEQPVGHDDPVYFILYISFTRGLVLPMETDHRGILCSTLYCSNYIDCPNHR